MVLRLRPASGSQSRVAAPWGTSDSLGEYVWGEAPSGGPGVCTLRGETWPWETTQEEALQRLLCRKEAGDS